MSYVLIRVDEGGYIRLHDVNPNTEKSNIVHRESRNIEDWGGRVFTRLADAKALLDETLGVAVLQLNELGGGGQAIWVRPQFKKEIYMRLSRWAGCYGEWKLLTFSS